MAYQPFFNFSTFQLFNPLIYDQQILRILTAVGDRGVHVQVLSKHVYNMNSSLFFIPDLHEIREYVQQYLLRNSKSPQSLIESTGKRGYYRLNTAHSADARQLVLQFREEKNEDVKEESVEHDYSLDLFSDLL